MSITTYYQNCRGLPTKTAEFIQNVHSESYDFIILTETWLANDIQDGELFNKNCVVYRKDRNLKITGLC
ncbi:uncharacterized protein LOC126882561 isoform X2 [Diabrotica virgifera virgifera]|uniref:RNA-directed DNA polymerase from mobile element jockey-like n=1 Tax=Diabrotica virgifera virgifera TaxID=50390 RepID=A0ABM5JZY3_DIAVI|nr:uncharacterized protein LOC126882561 isoform X2 [Diabrotica virgifera virgifera]